MSVKFGADPFAPDSLAKVVADNALSNVQGTLALFPAGKYVTGARVNLRINGRIVLFAFSVSWNINTEQDEIWTIDRTVPWELAPKRVSIEGTIGCFHMPFQTPTLNNMEADIVNFMFHKYITIEVKDRNTDALLFRTNKAVITSRQEDIRAEQIGTMHLRWKAIGWIDEGTSSLPLPAYFELPVTL